MAEISDRDPIYRRNFLCFLGDLLLFSIAMQFIDSSTVIPDFVRKLTDSEILIALSSQVFGIGYLLPQLLIARNLTRVERKKWWFAGPNIPVRFLVLVFAGVIVLLENEDRSVLLIAFFLFYGIAALGDGLVGVPWIDLIGSSLDDKRRAKLFGWGNASVGVLMLFLAPVAGYILGEPIEILGWHLDLPDLGLSYPHDYALLFGVSGVLFVLTIPTGLFIKELPGGKPRAAAPSLREYFPELVTVLREDRSFRAMIIVRILFAFFAIATPFYIGLATDRLGLSSGTAVRNLLFMKTAGMVSASILFAQIGDRRTTFLVRLGLGLGILQPILALIAADVGPTPLYFAFLVMGIVEGFLGFSFVNWVIMYATPDQRPIYSGLFNSVFAVALLIAPIPGGLLVESFGYEAAFIVALLSVVAAFFVAIRYVDAPENKPSTTLA